MGGRVMPEQAVVSWVEPSMICGRIDAEFYAPEVLAEAAWIDAQADSLCSLAQCLSLLTDGVHETPEFTNNGPLYLTATNIDPCHLNLQKGFKFTDEKTFLRYE